MRKQSQSKFGLKAALSLSVGLTAMISSANLTATAQEEGEEAKRLATVTTTASKREQTLQDVPIAVSVVDTEIIQNTQIVDILDLQSVVPSLRVSQLQQAGNSTFIIRGFGNGGNNVGIEPSVAVFIDGVYRTRAAGGLSDYADISRIEVLKGPQSTLFGKNASVGVISVLTEKPQYEFGGKVEATLGNYNSQILKGSVTGPLSEQVAFSLSAGTNTRDGYADNINTGGELNDRDRQFIKGQLLIEPTENLSIRLIADYDQLDEICCYAPHVIGGPTQAIIESIGGALSPDPFSYQTALDTEPTNEIENSGFSAQVDWETGFGTLTSITAIRDQAYVSDGDVDFTSAALTQQNLLDFDTEMFSQEIRLTGSSDRLDYLGGVYYFDETVSQDSNILFGSDFRPYADVLLAGAGASSAGLELLTGSTAGSFFAAGTGSTEQFTQDNTSYSIFGQLDFAVTDRLTATLGLAYINDEKDVTATINSTDAFSAIDLAVAFDNQAIVETLAGATLADITLGQVAGGNVPGVDLATYTTLLGAVDPVSVATVAAIQAGVQTGTAAAIADGLSPFQFLPGGVGFPNQFESGSSSDSDTTYTLRLAYDVNDSLNVYGSYATGFKATSWNLTRDSSFAAADEAALNGASLVPANRSAGTRFAEPEESEVIELGAKLSTGNLNVNLAIFEQTIENFQSTIFQGTGFVLSNAGSQSTQGIEFDVNWAATDNLTLTVAGLVQDPTFDSFTSAPNPWVVTDGLVLPGVFAGTAAVQTDADTVDLSGQQPAGIPETSLYFAAQYDMDFTDSLSGFVRGDYVHESDVQVVDNIVGLNREVGVLNASVGLDWDNGLSLLLWGKNLTEDEQFTSAFPSIAQSVPVDGLGSVGGLNVYANQPQTYGITVRKTF